MAEGLHPPIIAVWILGIVTSLVCLAFALSQQHQGTLLKDGLNEAINCASKYCHVVNQHQTLTNSSCAILNAALVLKKQNCVLNRRKKLCLPCFKMGYKVQQLLYDDDEKLDWKNIKLEGNLPVNWKKYERQLKKDHMTLRIGGGTDLKLSKELQDYIMEEDFSYITPKENDSSVYRVSFRKLRKNFFHPKNSKV